MPILILFIAFILLIAGINNQLGLLTSLVKEDIAPTNGSPSFGVWVLAIGIAGALGYSKDLKPISNGFLILIFLGILLSAQKGTSSGFFTNLQKAFNIKGSPSTSSNSSTGSNDLGGQVSNSIQDFVGGKINGVVQNVVTGINEQISGVYNI